MTEERYSLEKLVKDCKSIREVDDKLGELETDMMQFMLDSNNDTTIRIGVQHFKAVLTTIVGNDGRVKPIIEYADDPWHWYNIMPPKGFIFKW